MILGNLNVSDLDEVIDEINAKLKQRSKSSSELLVLRIRLEAMKVDLVGLADLREDFESGNITDENYRVQSKKLRTDIERSRNDANLSNILDTIEKKDTRLRLEDLRDKIISNKGFILFVLELMKSLPRC